MSQEQGSELGTTSRRSWWRQRRWMISTAVLLIIAVLCVIPSVRLHVRAVGLAQWAQPLATFTPLLLGAMAAIACRVAYRNYVVAREQFEHRRAADDATLQQRRAADARAEWWRRVQSAIELVTSQDREFTASGFTLLYALADDVEVSFEDVETLRRIIGSLEEDVVAAVEQELEASQPWSE